MAPENTGNMETFIFLSKGSAMHLLKTISIYTKIPEVNLFAFVYRLFHEDFSPIFGTCPDDWREIFMKQSVDKCKQNNF